MEIGFNPEDLQPEHEAYPAFQAGGMTLKFWALYKRAHLTCQHFKPALENLADYFEKMNDEDSEVEPYRNIVEFKEVLYEAGFRPYSSVRMPDQKWLIDNWDYLNLNIQKQLVLTYKAVAEVTKELAA